MRKCLTQCIEPCVDTGVLLAAALASQRHAESITEYDLTSCPRKLVLEREKDYYVLPKTLLYWLLRGRGAQNNALAALNLPNPDAKLEELRQAAMKNSLRGHRINSSLEIKGRTIKVSAGIYQYRFEPKPSLLEGFRPILSLAPVVRSGAKAEHAAQMNFAAHLIALQKGQPVDSIKIHYITPDEALSVPVSVWPDEEVRRKIYPRIEMLDKCFKDGLKPPCEPGENKWRCRLCPFSGAIKHQSYCMDMFADSQDDPANEIAEPI